MGSFTDENTEYLFYFSEEEFLKYSTILNII